MIANHQRLLSLLSQYAKNEISLQDFDELITCMKQPDADPILLKALTEINKDLVLSNDFEADKGRIYQQIINHPDFIISKSKRVKNYTFWRGAAAAVLLLALGMVYKFSNNTIPKQTASIKKPTVIEKIDMGSKTAVLTLSDGRQVPLGKSNSGLITKDAGSSINQQQGSLKYDNVLTGGDREALNTITVPRASNYQLILSDGTKVWLNTNSSLTYPVAFTGKYREVTLKGEAYFEVAHNSARPFIVKNELADVTVLGTHFNLKAYPNEKMTTTLLNGSVKVSKLRGNSIIIKPDQEAVIDLAQNNIVVNNVDAEESIAWKMGYFLFNKENIKQVMQTIGHWYHVDIAYKGSMDGKTFSGTIARFENIDDLLKSIELTGVIHFKKEGRRIIVMP